jgi:cyanate permease
MIYCFAFLFGLFHGSRIVSWTGIVGSYFGMKSLGELIGITEAISLLPGAITPYLVGYIFDATGNYSLAFIIVTGIIAAGGVIAAFIKPPKINQASKPA